MQIEFNDDAEGDDMLPNVILRGGAAVTAEERHLICLAPSCPAKIYVDQSSALERVLLQEFCSAAQDQFWEIVLYDL
jgi:hypothetical protein